MKGIDDKGVVMEIPAEKVKELRDQTNVGMMDCKNALKEAKGDINTAMEILKIKGIAVAAKKSSRTANQGIIGSYLHMGGKIGVLVEINCETDFVAKNENFQAFVKDIAMQIAASDPKYVKREEVPEDIIEKERKIFTEQVTGKPENVIEKIVDGKMEKFYSEFCLLDQIFVKDTSVKVKELLTSKITEIGENIIINRFSRFQVGKE
ncbi:MAG: translation elongation factor Ts [Candidatus Ancaeobacter aquaticus]|nr:translation elongation factor Ts [Candidatus Ancaeobacter aquaticus]